MIQTYSHDYLLPSMAALAIYDAMTHLRYGNGNEAYDACVRARECLLSYLSKDNIVADDDCEPAWVRFSDVQLLLKNNH